MVRITERSPPVLAATLTRIVAFPLPDAGAIEAQELSLDAVQAHAACVRTAISAESPCAERGVVTLPISYRQGAGCWDTATARSATVRLACRATGSAFWATVNVTVPSPWPSALEVNVIQFTGVTAFHEQSRVTPTDRLPVPPSGAKVLEDIPTVAWQRAVPGAVMDVDVFAELPQPIAKSEREKNSRADVRAITFCVICILFASSHRSILLRSRPIGRARAAKAVARNDTPSIKTLQNEIEAPRV